MELLKLLGSLSSTLVNLGIFLIFISILLFGGEISVTIKHPWRKVKAVSKEQPEPKSLSKEQAIKIMRNSLASDYRDTVLDNHNLITIDDLPKVYRLEYERILKIKTMDELDTYINETQSITIELKEYKRTLRILYNSLE